MLHIKPQGLALEKNIFEWFLPVWASWTCDPDARNKFLFPHMKFGFDRPSGFGEDL